MTYIKQHLKYNTNMTGKVKKILEEIHPLDIIREVQKWPALYVKDSPERANTHFKLKIWHEVAKELFPEWDIYSKSDKDNKITDLMKKWRNLRDTCKRQVEIERKIREGYDIKKKVYVYYNHMSFLLPHLQAGDSEQEESPSPKEPHISKKRKLKHKGDNPKRSFLDQSTLPSTSVYLEEIDEDKHFLMSLIPSFKKMTDDEKLTVKMEILKAIKGVRNISCSSTENFNYQVVDCLAYNNEIGNSGNDELKKELCIEEDSVEIDPQQPDSDEDESE